MGGHAEELVLHPGQLAPLGDVAPAPQVDRAGRQLDRLDARFDRHDRAVLAPQLDLAEPAPLAGEPGELAPDPGLAIGHDASADIGQLLQLVVAVAEQLSQGAVGGQVAAAGVGDQDGVRGALEQAAIARFGRSRVRIEPGVVDGHGGAMGELLGQRQVVRPVAPDPAGDQQERPQRPPAGHERDGERGPEAGLPQELEVPGVAGNGLEVTVGDLRHQLRPARAERLGHAAVRGMGDGRVPLQLADERLLGRIHVLRHQAADSPLLVEQVDHAAVGQVGHRQARQALEGGLVIERAGQDAARFGQERRALFGCFSLRQGAFGA